MEKMEQAFPNPHRTDMTGMTLRQHAAIKLKVPDSGTDWLDDMIRQSLKDDFAAKAMQGAMSGCAARGEVIMYSDLAGLSYELADAMMRAREA